MAIYTFSSKFSDISSGIRTADRLYNVLIHAKSLGMTLSSVDMLPDKSIHVTLVGRMPDDQAAHLDMEEVI